MASGTRVPDLEKRLHMPWIPEAGAWKRRQKRWREDVNPGYPGGMTCRSRKRPAGFGWKTRGLQPHDPHQ